MEFMVADKPQVAGCRLWRRDRTARSACDVAAGGERPVSSSLKRSTDAESAKGRATSAPSSPFVASVEKPCGEPRAFVGGELSHVDEHPFRGDPIRHNLKRTRALLLIGGNVEPRGSR